MRVRFFGQPYENGADLRDFLSEVAADQALTDLTVVVAWAKASGLDRIRPQLEAIADRGGCRMVVGIDEGGATIEGLKMALELFDTVHVFHDRSSGTFHPKIYLARGSSRALVLVGSNNLTAGGLFANHEAALVVDASADSFAEEPVAGVQAYIDDLYADTGICIPLTDELLADLIADGRYNIRSERQRRGADESDHDPPEDATGESIFGNSRWRRRTGPPRATASQASRDRSRSTRNRDSAVAGADAGTGRQASASGGTLTTPTVVKRWFKTMTHSDAQQKRTANTKITGNVKLTQAGLPINHETWFRHELYGPASWVGTATSRGTKERATVSTEVFVDGQSLGSYNLHVDHAEYRIANQANVPTWLHWGDFGSHMKQNNHVGKVVTLERISDGTYRLFIGVAETGPAIT